MAHMRTLTGFVATGLLVTGLIGFAQSEPVASGRTPPKASITETIRTGLVLPTVLPWAVGQQSTHKLTWDGGTQGVLTLDARFALTGQENGKFWYEWNFTNPGGSIGQDIAPYTGGLTLRFLTRQMTTEELKAIIEDAVALDSTAASGLITRFQFQIAGQPLYEVSFQDLATQATAIVIGETTPDGATPQIQEPKGTFTWDTGKETVVVPAGTFQNSDFWQADFAGDDATGNVHVNLHDSIPLMPLAKVVANLGGTAVGGANQIKLELISSARTGAQTKATGEPIMKTADEVVSELFMLIMTGGQQVEMQ